MTRAGVVAILLIGTMATASAAPQCYHANEIEADQAVRYQAKLMVLSDSCRSTSYTQFLQKNGDVIAGYQRELVGYFRRADGRSGETGFDRFLTRVANQFALGAGQEPLQSLCGRSADFLTQAVNFGKEEFRHFMAQEAAAERRSYKTCPN